MTELADMAMSVTDDTIEDLCVAAGRAGDALQVAVCLVALGIVDDDRVLGERPGLERLGIFGVRRGETYIRKDAGVRARAECARVIRNGRG